MVVVYNRLLDCQIKMGHTAVYWRRRERVFGCLAQILSLRLHLQDIQVYLKIGELVLYSTLCVLNSRIIGLRA